MSVAAEAPRSAAAARRLFARFAPLFRYPDGSWDSNVTAALIDLAGVTVSSPTAEAAAASLRRFEEAMSSLDLRERQAIYTSTFDLAPSCSPYLGAHRFGDESPERARLMVGLRMRYGGGESAELPDHIAEVLGFAEEFYEEEWTDLGTLVIGPAVQSMDAILTPTSNPYRLLLSAARELCDASFPERGV